MSTSEPQSTEPDTTNTPASTQPTDALTRELPARDDAETLQLWATSPESGASTNTAETAALATAPANAAPGTAAAAPAAGAAAAPSAAAAAAPTHPQSRLRVRVGTIVGGVVLLVIAGLARVATLIDPADYTPTFIIWSVIGFGGLLVIAGVAAAVVKAVTRRPGTARWE